MNSVDALKIHADAARVLRLKALRLAILKILREQRERLRTVLRKRVLIRTDIANVVCHRIVVAVRTLDVELVSEAPVELIQK